jgi:rhodanese-related sulfurtransferase
MKIKSAEALELYKKGEVEFIDIRFREEQASWNFPFMKKIPLNELPNRLGELDKNKTIITVCPHYDRAEIARLYLTMKGYKSRYLTDGLLGLAGYLRGDEAKEFIEETKDKK